jgi:hypothetical protein
LSSSACCLYSATDLTSSLWDSSFLNSQSCNECFHRDVLIELSKASVTSVVFLGVRRRPHFLEICPLRKSLQPIFYCDANASLTRILRGTKEPLKGGTCRGVSFLYWKVLKYFIPCSMASQNSVGMSKCACEDLRLSQDSFLFIVAPGPGHDRM